MLKGSAEVPVALGTVITVVVVLAMMGLVLGAFIQVENELRDGREELAAVAMKHAVVRCLEDVSKGMVTETVLETADKDIEDLCGLDGVSAEVRVRGGRVYDFGGGKEKNSLLITVRKKNGEPGIAEVRVKVNV